MNPHFSIVIPLYNKANHIKTTLRSVLDQNFRDFEIIIINDGSTDDSLGVVEAFSDERINIYSIENNGVSYARNFGVTKATTEFIVFLDADDIWKPHHLEDLKELQEEFPNCGMYAKAYVRKYKTFEIKSLYNNIPTTNNWKGVLNDYFDNSMINGIASSSSVMIPKKTLIDVGNFNEAYNSGEDTDLWIRIALKHPVAFYNKVSVIHNLKADNKITDSSLTNRKHADFNAFKTLEKTNLSLKTYLDLNRYALAMEYKMEGNTNAFQNQLEAVDLNSLSASKKISLKLPIFILKILINFRNRLRLFKIDLRLFR